MSNKILGNFMFQMPVLLKEVTRIILYIYSFFYYYYLLLLYCSVYDNLGQNYLSKKYYKSPNVNKFYILMLQESWKIIHAMALPV